MLQKRKRLKEKISKHPRICSTMKFEKPRNQGGRNSKRQTNKGWASYQNNEGETAT